MPLVRIDRGRGRCEAGVAAIGGAACRAMADCLAVESAKRAWE